MREAHSSTTITPDVYDHIFYKWKLSENKIWQCGANQPSHFLSMQISLIYLVKKMCFFSQRFKFDYFSPPMIQCSKFIYHLLYFYEYIFHISSCHTLESILNETRTILNVINSLSSDVPTRGFSLSDFYLKII